MSLQTWQEVLVNSKIDGPVLTAAAAAQCIPPGHKITLPNNYLTIGRLLLVRLIGRISCVVTTPGTARFDVRLGGTVVFDTGALNLNIVAKTTVPFWLEALLTVRAEGAAANLIGQATFQSEAVVGSPANTAGGNGSLLCPVGAPVVGNNVDGTTALGLDVFFTQTVATGSMTVHQYLAAALN